MSMHMTHMRKGFVQTRRADVKAQFGRNGDMEKVEVMGSWKGRSYGLGKDLKSLTKKEKMVLDDVLWVKDLKNNLFSVTRAIKDGARVTNNGEALVVECEDRKCCE